jgi:excisionase family DNA binding protein
MARLLIADEVVAQLRIGKDWLYAEVRAGRFPAVRCGRFYRFRQEDVDAWITRQLTTNQEDHTDARR